MKAYLVIVGAFFSMTMYGQEKENLLAFKTEYSYQYALIEASRQKMIGNVNEAVNLYLSCINANPECDVAYYELGTVYSAMGENKKSEEQLAKAYKLNPQNYWYGIAYSELLELNKNITKSLKILRKTRKLSKPNGLSIDFKIAGILAEKGKYLKALNLLEEIEKENGTSEMISYKKFEIYKLKKEYGKAELVISDLMEKAPDVPDYQILMAEFYTEIGDSISAIKAYEKAYQIDSLNIYAITNLADMYSSFGDDEKAFFFLNQAFLNKNIPLKSKIQTMMYLNKDRDMIRKKRIFVEEMVNSLLAEYPDNYDVNTVAYDFYNGLEDHKMALSIIKTIIIQKKDDYIIWQQALYSASMVENYDEIILIGEEALKYFPNKNEIYLFVGMAYFQKEKFDESYSVLSIAFPSVKENDKLKIQFLLFLSEAAYSTERKQESYVYFEQLIKNDPTNDFTKNNYSYYLALDSMDLLKAKNLSYSTIMNSPENSTFLDTYAWILFKMGNYEEAKYYSEKALIINAESDADLIFHYAEILFAINDFDLSKKYYKLALDRGYDKEIIGKKLLAIPEDY
jgi:tetratricopeptide (TPR) repeat protein